MSIDWARLRSQIIEAGVIAIDGQLNNGLLNAQRDVPVRKVFAGGRQTVRFKTAGEIERDRPIRAALGLAPEILATPAKLAATRARGINPIHSTHFKGEEFGFARTIEHPARGSYRDASGRTRAERGLTQGRSNKANAASVAASPGGGSGRGGFERRIINPGITSRNQLLNRDDEAALTARGRYELAGGRAIHQHMSRELVGARTDLATGRISFISASKKGVETLGGGLRSTIRIERADPGQFPELTGWLLAGDEAHKYAKYQEMGTRHNPAHPFLRPRLPEWREGLPRGLVQAFGRLGR